MIITVIVLMLLGAGCSVLAYMAGKDDGFEEGLNSRVRMSVVQSVHAEKMTDLLKHQDVTICRQHNRHNLKFC